MAIEEIPIFDNRVVSWEKPVQGGSVYKAVSLVPQHFGGISWHSAYQGEAGLLWMGWKVMFVNEYDRPCLNTTTFYTAVRMIGEHASPTIAYVNNFRALFELDTTSPHGRSRGDGSVRDFLRMFLWSP